MINKLPALSDPVKYAGLYIFDFGDHVSVGYTSQEVEFLLADPRYARGMVYKIYRAYADGRLEIRGVNPLLWNVSTGIVFWFRERPDADEAFARLKSQAAVSGPPGEFDLFMIQKGGSEYPYALIMRYVRELDDAMAGWLLKVRFQVGERVEAGTQLISPLLANGAELLFERLGAEGFRKSRTRQEVLDAVHHSVQR